MKQDAFCMLVIKVLVIQALYNIQCIYIFWPKASDLIWARHAQGKTRPKVMDFQVLQILQQIIQHVHSLTSSEICRKNQYLADSPYSDSYITTGYKCTCHVCVYV